MFPNVDNFVLMSSNVINLQYVSNQEW